LTLSESNKTASLNHAQSPGGCAQVSSLLAAHLAAGDFPSAVYLIAERGQVAFADALGYAVLEPQIIPASIDTIYDLASLTKPLVTGLLCAQLIESGELRLDTSAAHYLPEFARPDKRMITLQQLLTHSSGLPAWRPLYLLAENREAVLAAIASEGLEYSPGTRVVYSDLGFITLGFLLERLTGESFVQLAISEIFTPLKLQETFFNPGSDIRSRIAASETGNAYEVETVGKPAPVSLAKLELRSKTVIWGEVHDGNAFYLGGAAGHAGLFSTVRETLRLAEQFIAARSELLQADTCAMFRTNLTTDLEEARSASWQLALTKDSTASPDLPPESFGHTGFTGTSCWIDPIKERVFILLTNRTHARALPFANINSVRRQFHSLAAHALDRPRSADFTVE
jgi:CubicO group peptidase (beta-lactamase class C family)